MGPTKQKLVLDSWIRMNGGLAEPLPPGTGTRVSEVFIGNPYGGPSKACE
jgi:hypothetical protein